MEECLGCECVRLVVRVVIWKSDNMGRWYMQRLIFYDTFYGTPFNIRNGLAQLSCILYVVQLLDLLGGYHEHHYQLLASAEMIHK